MKNFKSLLAFLALSSQLHAQVEMETWKQVESAGPNFDPIRVESLADGKFHVGGTSFWYNIGKYEEWRGYFFSLTRHLPDGQWDPSFKNAYFYGTNTFMQEKRYFQGKDWLRLPDNKLFLVGREIANGQNQLFVSIISEDGHSSTAPILHGPQVPKLEIANLAMLTNGEIVVGGYGTNPSTGDLDFFLAKFNQKGEQLALNYNKQFMWYNHGPSDTCTSVVAGDFNYLYLCGHTRDNGRSKFLVYGLNEHGHPIQGVPKRVFSVSTSGDDRLLKAVYHPSNRLYMVGASRIYTNKYRDVISVVKLTWEGTPDPQFDYDGKAFVYVGGGHDRGQDLKVAKDGSLYIGGVTQYFNSYQPIVIHMGVDGKLDPNFGNKGIFKFNSNLEMDGNRGKYNVALDLTQDNKILVAAGQPARYWVAKIKQPASNSPAAFITEQADPCSGQLTLTPKNGNGYHTWNFGDNETSTDANPTHTYYKQGKYNITHTYRDLLNNTHSYTQYVEVGKSPRITTVGEYMMPTFTPNPTRVRVQDFYAPDYYNLEWSPQNAIVAKGDLSASFKFTTPGIYDVSVTATHKIPSLHNCYSKVVDTLIIPPYFDACTNLEGEDSLPVGPNLIQNGTFDDNTCPPTSFWSHFPFKCTIGGEYEPEKTAIVSNIEQYSHFYNVSDTLGDAHYTLNSLNGNFLLLAERIESKGENFGRYEKVRNRTAWSQQVYVEAGVKYAFRTGLANISKAILGEYTFPQFHLVVDNVPVAGNMLTSGIESLCGYYTATHTGWVTLEIVRQNGFWFSDGHSAVDNIQFYAVRYPSSARLAEASEAITTYTNSETGTLEVELSNVPEGPITLQLVEAMTGRVRNTVRLSSPRSSVDISSLGNGVYISRFLDKNDSFLRSKKFGVVR